MLLQQKPSPFRIKRVRIEERVKPKPLSTEERENIYKYDLFDTFRAKPFVPTAEKLISPTPKPREAPPPKTPEVAKPQFIPSLKVTLKGIVYSSNEEKSICIIEDEAKREAVYHVGDTLKDAQIIKIAQNRITALRVNGQHETISLRKEEKKPDLEKKEWDDIVRKIDESTFEIDIIKFPREIASLGALMERLSLITEYQKANPIGIKVLNLPPGSIGSALGLQQNDLITSINGINTADKKDRIKIYDTIANLKKNNTIKASIKRNNTEVTLTYNLTDIKKVKKRIFAPGKKSTEPTTEEKLFKLSSLQEREKQRREFAEKHKSRQTNVIEEIRKRLLDNMKSKVRNTRTRTQIR